MSPATLCGHTAPPHRHSAPAACTTARNHQTPARIRYRDQTATGRYSAEPAPSTIKGTWEQPPP